MATTEPIRKEEDVIAMMKYYVNNDNYRNYCLLCFGFNTALRIGDILRTKWGDIYNFETDAYKPHVFLVEQKTKKAKWFPLNEGLLSALKSYREWLKDKGVIPTADTYLFTSQKGINRPIGRIQAYRITLEAARNIGLEFVIGCHSMRKTFGHNACIKGAPPTAIMELFNHSSFQVTKRYLGISQDEKDSIYMAISFDINK